MSIRDYFQNEVTNFNNRPSLKEIFQHFQEASLKTYQAWQPIPVEELQESEKLFVSYKDARYEVWIMSVEQRAFHTPNRNTLNDYLEEASRQKNASIIFSDSVCGGSYCYDFHYKPSRYLFNVLLGLLILVSMLLFIQHVVSFLFAGVILAFCVINTKKWFQAKRNFSSFIEPNGHTETNTFADDTTHLLLHQRLVDGGEDRGKYYKYIIFTAPGHRKLLATRSRKKANQLIKECCHANQLSVEYSDSVSVKSLDYQLNSPPTYYLKCLILYGVMASILLLANSPLNFEEDTYLICACILIPSLPLIYFLRSLYELSALKKSRR